MAAIDRLSVTIDVRHLEPIQDEIAALNIALVLTTEMDAGITTPERWQEIAAAIVRRLRAIHWGRVQDREPAGE